ncbi:hypothetical protein A2335_04800 [Candidatus Peregrinibacteria bacterium RIFOXYB2_FULL_32_7]|nr:MAG: hypothetical protein A2335_04800 [Candidatus Peregrinibacteria bacterium RIFOXYB2_FULL_32_7]
MKHYYFIISIFILISLILIGCSVNENSTISFAPNGGVGNIVQLKTLEEASRFLVFYQNLNKVSVEIYKVDKESFFNNKIGAFAAFEGHLDKTTFNNLTPVFIGDLEIFNILEAKDSELNGYIVLPIKKFGYYYIAYTYESNVKFSIDQKDFKSKYHTLLEINENPEEFNY